MKVTIHQPDLLPYSGFWFKMATCDTFILSVHDQFQKHGYQRRVKMRDAWCSHQLVGKPALVPINSIEVAEGWQQRIADVVRGRYAGSKFFSTRGAELVDRILACEGRMLDEVNISMIEAVRDMLGIETPLVVTDPPTHAATERLIEQVQMVGGSAYLAGQGGKAYMGDDPEARFAEEGLELLWSDHQHSTGDSIVSVLMDEDDPMEIVLRRVG
ncbi:hypothetical protein J2X46_001115 [Nocardioides sp. BE266]|uniref:WbqC family protein n=1 Tax=Nocardioides sp. BE266 TaxID=2817725 RepID=UPI002866B575|nr:WbqC family protein [Nocardioides sp. BE266]MDR7252139.1 hypothetical protein [Nocardioides sp. BE266]